MTLRRSCLSQDLKKEQAGEEEWETAPGRGDGMYKRPGAGKIDLTSSTPTNKPTCPLFYFIMQHLIS